MRSPMTTATATAITTASAFAGAPVRADASPRRRVMKPSRPFAYRMRDAPVAVPSALANALTIAPKLTASA